MNWNNALQDCSTHDCVLEVVNEFLATREPAFWSALPRAAHPGEIATGADIHRWHHRLVQELRRVKPVPLELQELCVLFLRASVRLHQIELRESVNGRPSNDELACAPRPRRSRLAR